MEVGVVSGRSAGLVSGTDDLEAIPSRRVDELVAANLERRDRSDERRAEREQWDLFILDICQS